MEKLRKLEKIDSINTVYVLLFQTLENNEIFEEQKPWKREG